MKFVNTSFLYPGSKRFWARILEQCIEYTVQKRQLEGLTGKGKYLENVA